MRQGRSPVGTGMESTPSAYRVRAWCAWFHRQGLTYGTRGRVAVPYAGLLALDSALALQVHVFSQYGDQAWLTCRQRARCALTSYRMPAP